MARGCPQLQSLDIICCRMITDEGIRAVASGLLQLQSLNIAGCDNITNKGIRALASGCPQLKFLERYNCLSITTPPSAVASVPNIPSWVHPFI